tara:strand:+ start:52 stop:339 length:288 start_codon:yes stop_codon:yes gene_type:complete
MSEKKSYMDNKIIMNESFIDDLLDKLYPGTKMKDIEKHLPKRKRKKLKKYEDKLEKVEKEIKQATQGFEMAYEKETGKKIKLDDISLDDLLKKYR